MTIPRIDINEEIDKMLKGEKGPTVAACAAQAAAIRYLVLRKNAILLPAAHEVAHRERVMVPADRYDDLVLQLERTSESLFQTSNTAEQMCLERNAAQDQCRELAQRIDEQAKTIANLERQLYDRGRP